MYILMAIGASLCFSIGGIFMHMSQGVSQILPTSLIYICFGLGATLQTLTMQKYGGMGMTYVLIIGIEAILAVIFGAIIFQEGYSLLRLVGIGLIITGVVFLHSGNT